MDPNQGLQGTAGRFSLNVKGNVRSLTERIRVIRHHGAHGVNDPK